MEFRRIFARGRTWGIFALLFGLNLILFYWTQERTYATEAGFYNAVSRQIFSEYDALLAETAELSEADCVAWCREWLEQKRTLGEQGEWTLREFVLQRYFLLDQLHIAQFPDYMRSIQENVKQLSGIRIFAADSSFSSRNIQVTAEDFQPVADVQPVRGNYYAVDAILNYHIGDYLLLLLLIFVCWSFLEERKKGLWGIVHLAAGGRLRLNQKRLLLLTGMSLCFSALFYGTVFAVSVQYFGSFSFSVPVQSVAALEKLPLAISLGEFLLLFLALKTVCVLLFGLLMWMILSSFENFSIALGVLGCLIGAEYLLFAHLPAQSILNFFKYFNICSYFFLEHIFETYLNLNFFGIPLNARRAVLAFLPVLLLLSAAAAVAVNCRKHPGEKNRYLLIFLDRIQKGFDFAQRHLRFWLAECYKVFAIGRGALLLGLLFVLLLQIYPIFETRYEDVKSMLEYRLEEWEGPIDSAELREKMQVELQYITERQEEYARTREQYEAGDVSSYDMEIATQLMTNVEQRNQVYLSVETRIAQLSAAHQEGEAMPWLLNYKWLLRLFGPDVAARQQLIAVLALLFLVLLAAPVYALENQTGVRYLIRGAGKGRWKFIWGKQGLLLVLAILVAGMIYGIDWYSVEKNFGIHGWDAPIQSIPWMLNSDWRLTVGQLTVLMTVLRFLTLWAVGQIALFFSACAGRVYSAILFSLLLLVLPTALWMAGIGGLQFCSVGALLCPMTLFEASAFTGLSVIIPYGVLFACGALAAVGSVRAWLQTR